MTTPKMQTPAMVLTRFFVPLALQAASQGITYPLVTMVASRGPGGPLNMAGLVQANTVMFLLGTLGFGLVTTGMVYGRTRQGFKIFQSVTLQVALVIIGIQAILCLPAPAHLLFEKLIGLPPSIAYPARITLLASIPLQYLFFLRVPYQVAMYNARATARASMATLMRILLTLLLSPLFSRLGWVGPLWAICCLSVPVALEVGISQVLARAYLQRLAPSAEKPPKKRELLLFNLTLSAGGYLLSLAAIVLGAFMARAAQPEIMLPVYYLALGVVTPVAYGATRVQEVVLAFPPESDRNTLTLRFALTAGVIISLLPLMFIIPGLAKVYYVEMQKLPLQHLPLVRQTALILFFYPLCIALRAQGEGLAGLRRKPLTVIAGQAVFMGSVVVIAAVLLILEVPGNLIGACGLIVGNLSSTVTLRLLLHRIKPAAIPVPQTTTSHGQVR